MKRKHCIVGIDPGLYTAVVILDLNGNIVREVVRKNFGEENVVDFILETCDPSVIATDVNPAPDFVIRLAARFNAKLFVPQKSLTKIEKSEIGKEKKDPHIRDAYAAAVKAYRFYANKFRHINNLNINDEKKEELKHLFTQGVRLHDFMFHKTVEETEGKEKRHSKEKLNKRKREADEIIELERTISILKKSNERCRERNKNLKVEISKLKQKIRKMDRIIRTLLRKKRRHTRHSSD